MCLQPQGALEELNPCFWSRQVWNPLCKKPRASCPQCQLGKPAITASVEAQKKISQGIVSRRGLLLLTGSLAGILTVPKNACGISKLSDVADSNLATEGSSVTNGNAEVLGSAKPWQQQAENVKSWYKGEGFVLRVPPRYEDVLGYDEEEGMGKTVQMIALMLTERSPEGMSTLIVAPASVVNQWGKEISAYCIAAGGMKVLLYHGSKRIQNRAFIASHDVVVTSYTLMAMEAPERTMVQRTKGGPISKTYGGNRALGVVKWFRIILDECQIIRNYSTQNSMGAFCYQVIRRWCLSGTAVQNTRSDLLGYYRFLQYKPFCSREYFRKLMNACKTQHGDARELLKKSFAAIALRREKSKSAPFGQPNFLYTRN